MEKKTVITSGIRTVAVFEALKGVLVLLAGFGLLSLVHRDLEEVAEHLVRISHLNPAYHYPRIFIEAATHTDNNRLKLYDGIIVLYLIFVRWTNYKEKTKPAGSAAIPDKRGAETG